MARTPPGGTPLTRPIREALEGSAPLARLVERVQASNQRYRVIEPALPPALRRLRHLAERAVAVAFLEVAAALCRPGALVVVALVMGLIALLLARHGKATDTRTFGCAITFRNH